METMEKFHLDAPDYVPCDAGVAGCPFALCKSLKKRARVYFNSQLKLERISVQKNNNQVHIPVHQGIYEQNYCSEECKKNREEYEERQRLAWIAEKTEFSKRMTKIKDTTRIEEGHFHQRKM